MEEARQISFEEMEMRAVQSQKKVEHFFTRLFSIAWDILTDRLLLLLAMGGTGGMFFWAMVEPTFLRYALSVTFGLVVYLPMLWLSLKRKRNG